MFVQFTNKFRKYLESSTTPNINITIGDQIRSFEKSEYNQACKYIGDKIIKANADPNLKIIVNDTDVSDCQIYGICATQSSYVDINELSFSFGEVEEITNDNIWWR